MEKLLQTHLFTENDIYAGVDANGDILKELNSIIDWSLFEPILKKVFPQDKNKYGGRTPYPRLFMFKVLVIQHFYALSDSETEAQINDRITFKRFLGLELCTPSPDSTTIRNYREKLTQCKGEEELFNAFHEHLKQKGFITKKGSIIDAQIIEVPKNHYTKEEKQAFSQGTTPELWEKKPNRVPQLDTDATHTKKRNQHYHGYKNHIKVDAESKLIDKYVVTTASEHDSRAVDMLLNQSDKETTVWMDSAYIGPNVQKELDKVKAKGKICERPFRNRPLRIEQKKHNQEKSRIRARVEHVFGAFKMQFGNWNLNTIGIERACVAIGLSNLVYNMLRYAQLLTGRALFRTITA